MVAVGYTGGDPNKVSTGGYTKGAVLVANSTGTLTPLAVGPDADVLTANSLANTQGVDWEVSSGGGAVAPGLALVQSNMQRLLTKMTRAQEDAAILVISDSTAAITTRWVYVSAGQIAVMFPAWTVVYHLWDPTGGAAYDTGTAGTPTTIQTGSGSRTLHIWNMSVTGKQTSYCLAGRYALGIQATNPDLIIVSHGKNEQNPTGDLETNRALWRGQMLALTERVTYTFPTAGLLITLQHRNVADNLMALRNRVYEEVAAMRGFGIVPVYDAFEATGHPNDFIRPDGIHPTDATDPAAPPPGPGQTTPARDGIALWVLTLMRGFTYQVTGKISSQDESALVQIAEQKCPNGNFAAFTSAVPDSWTANNCTTSKDVRAGWFESTNGYAVRIQASSAAASFIDQFIPNGTLYIGRVVTLRVRARVAAGTLTTATGLRVGLADGVSTSALSYTKTDAVDGFFDTIVSLRMAPSATYLRVLIYADTAANGTADITVDSVHLTSGLLPRHATSGAVGPQGVPGPAASAFDHLSTFGTNPAVSYLANTPFVLGGANQGIAVPVIPNRNMTPTKLFWLPGVLSGNYDVAILGATGTRLWSKGSTLVTSGVKTETVTGVNLVAGTTYWVMIAFDNTTAQVYGISAQYEQQGRLATNVAFARTVSAVFPIPAPVTLGATGSAKIPLMVLTE